MASSKTSRSLLRSFPRGSASSSSPTSLARVVVSRPCLSSSPSSCIASYRIGINTLPRRPQSSSLLIRYTHLTRIPSQAYLTNSIPYYLHLHTLSTRLNYDDLRLTCFVIAILPHPRIGPCTLLIHSSLSHLLIVIISPPTCTCTFAITRRRHSSMHPFVQSGLVPHVVRTTLLIPARINENVPYPIVVSYLTRSPPHWL